MMDAVVEFTFRINLYCDLWLEVLLAVAFFVLIKSGGQQYWTFLHALFFPQKYSLKVSACKS